MIGANLFCAGAVAVMLAGTSPGRYWVLYAALAAENAGTVLYAPALQARIPAVVGTGPLLGSANSLTSASSGIVRLIGGPLGGVLLACGIRWLISADAASYLLAAAAVFLTSRSGGGHPGRTAVFGAVARDLAEGARVLRAQPVARALLPVTAVFLTANAALSAVLIPFGVRRLGGSEHTGLLLSCLGTGFLLGAPVIRTSRDRAGQFTQAFDAVLADAGIEVVKIPPRSPKSNAYAERWVCTARAEVTDRMLIAGPRHLRAVLDEYVTHYNHHRPHRTRNLRPPDTDDTVTAPVTDLAAARIRHRNILGGLIHEYERAA